MQSKSIYFSYMHSSIYSVGVSVCLEPNFQEQWSAAAVCIFWQGWVRPQFPTGLFPFPESHGQHKHEQVSRHIGCRKAVWVQPVCPLSFSINIASPRHGNRNGGVDKCVERGSEARASGKFTYMARSTGRTLDSWYGLGGLVGGRSANKGSWQTRSDAKIISPKELSFICDGIVARIRLKERRLQDGALVMISVLFVVRLPARFKTYVTGNDSETFLCCDDENCTCGLICGLRTFVSMPHPWIKGAKSEHRFLCDMVVSMASLLLVPLFFKMFSGLFF